MLTIELYKKTNQILKALSEASYMNQTLEEISEFYISAVQDSVSHANSIYNLMGYIRSRFIYNKQTEVVKKIKSRLLFKDIENLQSILKSTNFSDNITTLNQNDIIHYLEKFVNSYEDYIDTQEPNIAVPLIINAVSLRTYLNGYIHGLEIFTKNYEVIPINIKNNEELSIILSSKMTLSEFIIKLQSIEQIYEELCSLMNISIIDYPIQISKIESGSLWVKIFGNSKVIALLTDSIKSSAEFIHRNYTKEGEIASIPKKVESIDSLFELRKKLEDAGISTEHIDDNIKKSSILLSNNMNKLLGGEKDITINDTKISIDGQNGLYIENKKTPTIKHNTNKN